MELEQRLAGLSPADRTRLERELLARTRRGRPRRRATSTTVGPLSWSQQSMWLAQQLTDGSAYHLGLHCRLTGPVDPELVRAAFTAAVARHDALRTVIDHHDGVPYQRVLEHVAFTVDGPYDVSDLARAAARVTDVPFDLTQAPLMRAALVRHRDEWVLLMVVHHLVLDGVSAAQLLRELLADHEALRAAEPSPVHPPATRYLDYAIDQRARAGDYEDRLAAWAGYDGFLDLPTDHPRPARFTGRGARCPLRLPARLCDRLRTVAASSDATLFHVVLTAVAVLLHRYSGQDELVVGVPVDNRRDPDLDGVLGLFVDTVPLRVDFAGDPAFRDVLAEVRASCLDALDREPVPIELLMARLGARRDPSRPAVVQAMVSFQDRAGIRFAHGDLRLELLDLGTRATKYELTFAMLADDAVDGYVEYNPDLYGEATVLAMLDHLLVLLDAIARDDRSPIGRLPLWEWPDRAVLRGHGGVTEGRPVHEMFLDVARRCPDRTAVVAHDGRLTYGELADRALRVAAGLGRLRPEQAIGLWADGTTTSIASMLGILCAGGTYVPLDPTHPRSRTDAMILAAGITTVLPNGVECPDPALPAPVSTDAAAYVLFTSGSTGVPKGVVVEHRQLAAYVAAVTPVLDVGPGARFAMVQPLTVDSCVTVLWPALTSGGTLHLLPRDEVADPEAMRRHITEHRIDVLKIAASHLTALADLPAPRVVVVGCEASDHRRLAAYRAANPGCRVINHYGPTETTVGVLTFEVGGPDAPGGPTPLTEPLAHADVHLLDRRLEPVPAGAVGEIYLGGACVTRGYLGMPALTAAAYLPDPHSPLPGARMYRTGDLARRCADGSLRIVGRADGQLKVRGHRVESSEVEARLVALPGVGQATVAVRGDALVAYVVRDGAAPVTLETVRRELGRDLPAPMVPSAVVVLDELPRASNGKILRAALPDPEPSCQPPTGSGPADELTALVATSWSEVLGVEEVGIDADFFELGGHSLLATQLVARIRAATGRVLPLRAVFDHPTVRGLTALVRGSATGELPLIPVDGDGEAPLSPAQWRMWFLTERDPDVPVYNVPTGFLVDGPLDVDALRRALTTVVGRHESLRTVFPVVGGTPVQRVVPAAEVPVTIVELDEETAREWALTESRRPFDLTRGPLLRASAARIRHDRWLLLIVLHHITFDRWSRTRFDAELVRCYEAGLAGRTAHLPPLPIQYRDFAVWQHKWLRDPPALAQLAYWRAQLANVPELTLDCYRPRPDVRDFRGEFVPFALSDGVWRRVRELAGKRSATPYMVLVAAFAALLRRNGAGTDLPVGTPIANRGRLELESLVGFFANTLVLRIDLAGDPSFADVVDRTRRVALDAYSNQDVPFDQLVEVMSPPRRPNRDPFFDVMFTFQNVPGDDVLHLPGLRLDPLPVEEWIAKRDLTMRVEESGGTVRGVLEYAGALIDPADARRLVGDYVDLLDRLTADPQLTIASLEADQCADVASPAVRQASNLDRFRRALRRPPTKVRSSESVPPAGTVDQPSRIPIVAERAGTGVDLIGGATDTGE